MSNPTVARDIKMTEQNEDTAQRREEIGVIDDLLFQLQAERLENEKLKEALQISNATVVDQCSNQTTRCEKAIERGPQRLDAVNESGELPNNLMDEVTSLKKDLLAKENENAELHRKIQDLQVTLHEAMGNPDGTCFMPGHVVLAADNKIDQEKARSKDLELQLRDLEAKFASKQEEFFSILNAVNKKLETSERARVALEKELEKVTHQKRALEKKLLSMQSSDRPLLPVHIDWFFNTNLWTSTVEFMEATAPSLTLCAGETIQSITLQLKREKLYLKQAKSLLSQHQDQLTTLLSALSKPCECQTLNYGRIEDHDVSTTIEALLRKVQCLQELLMAKDYEIGSLRSRKVPQETDQEKINILKSQLLVYRVDYMTEKKIKEQLMSELQSSKDENLVLREQLKSQARSTSDVDAASHMPCKKGWTVLLNPPPYSSVLPAVDGPSTSEQQHQLVCPNPECLRHFKTLDSLQHHVHQCLELSD